ncbi:MAG: membrane protein insertase YidC [Spirochaetaceae bacterium]|nr:membrane protein insertase YidC [Spirochaetaceae bacterium]
MLGVLYNSFIEPLIHFLELILNTAYSATGNYGLSIIIMSIAVNILIFPFYALAESWQKEERRILKKIGKKRDDIKAVFKGDEQYFYLRTLYRQNHYNPLMAIRSSFGLLIQIPFFIGAYQFLSHYQALDNQSFLFLNNLAKPDHLAKTVNLMPFIMTLINIASAYVYSKDFSRRDKIQLFAMAALFLVLLYNSPSGLLLYWTLNNFISLIKTLIKQSPFRRKLRSVSLYSGRIYRFLKIPTWSVFTACAFAMSSAAFYYLVKIRMANIILHIAYPVLLAAAVISALYFLWRYRDNFYYHLATLILSFLWFRSLSKLFTEGGPFKSSLKALFFDLIIIIVISYSLSYLEKLDSYMKRNKIFPKKQQNRFLYGSLSVLVLLGGAVLQSSLVASAPGEIGFSGSIVFLVFFRTLLWFGLVPLFFFYAGPKSFRRPILMLYIIFAFTALMNFLFFPGDYGLISDSLQFDSGEINHSRLQIMSNLVIPLLTGLAVLLLFILKKGKWILISLPVLVLALLSLTAINIFRIQTHESRNTSGPELNKELSPRIAFSKEQSNTVILFLDRALAGAVPIALKDFPELYDAYDGFTWYRDTLSFGVNTATAIPAMLGGYEYNPQGMIDQPEKSLIDKVTEAWMVLPTIFSQNKSSVYIEYNNNFHLKFPKEELLALSEDVTIDSFYDAFTQRWLGESTMISDFSQYLQRDKSLFMFSLMRLSPYYFRKQIYQNGLWNSVGRNSNDLKQVANLAGARDLLKEWSSLDYLPELSYTGSNKSTFSFVGNNSTHEVLGIDSTYTPSISEIDYPQEDLRKYGSTFSAQHIYTNVAVLKKVTDWLQWMKNNEVYDNTQIVIVSDHGQLRKKVYNDLFKGVEPDENQPDFNGFHPLLFFKPFKSRGKLEISDKFMTNADVPSLVLDAFGDFNNPYTGHRINSDKKSEPLLVGNGVWEIFRHLPDQYLYDESYYVKDSMLEPSNWSKIK